MYDVARAAGVSQTTVSFVINTTPAITISHKTRERILAVVTELNYRPSATARSLCTQHSYTIGFIADDMAIGTSCGTMCQWRAGCRLGPQQDSACHHYSAVSLC